MSGPLVCPTQSCPPSDVGTGSCLVIEYTHSAESDVATYASSDGCDILVFGGSVVVLAADMVESSKDDASLPCCKDNTSQVH